MRIQSYDVRMDSAGMRSSDTTRKFSVSLQGQNGIWGGFANMYQNLGSEKEQENARRGLMGRGDIMDRFRAAGSGRVNMQNERPTAARDLQSVKQQFVLYLWRIFFGEESAKSLAEKYGIEDMNQCNENPEPQPGFQTIQMYGVNEYYSVETQSVSFRSQGSVTTEDGRTIDFNFDVDMTSRFEQYYREEGVSIAKMCDPLVLNFTGDVADLSDQKFTFDLDCDGTAEEISTLKSGNGFLALDKNKDGVINDGSELFGAKSGDGFADLAAYDLDNNGWIDENDDIFNALKIWYKDEDGQDKLLDLKQAGVGAIYLGNAATDYNLRSENTMQLNGAIRKMGMFLYENATVGSMVHLDIAN